MIPSPSPSSTACLGAKDRMLRCRLRTRGGRGEEQRGCFRVIDFVIVVIVRRILAVACCSGNFCKFVPWNHHESHQVLLGTTARDSERSAASAPSSPALGMLSAAIRALVRNWLGLCCELAVVGTSCWTCDVVPPA